MKTETFLVLET